MTIDANEELRVLIEVITKEAASIGLMCHEARWGARLQARERPDDQLEGMSLQDEALRKAAERISNIIHLASERMDELAQAQSITS